MPESFDSDLRAYYRRQDEQDNICARIADDVYVQYKTLGRPQIFDIYRNGEYHFWENDIDRAIERCQECNQHDDVWEVKQFEEE
jgi:hypothetical protein